MKKFISELKRRNVFKVATTYAIAGWLIIQVVTSVFPAFKFPAWTSQFVIILVFIGFPISIILAWAFELTPDGVKRTEEVPVEKSITHKTGRKLNIFLGILLVLAVGFIFYQQLNKSKPTAANRSLTGLGPAGNAAIPGKSIAVLPFVNDSGDSTQRYFSDGLSESLIIALSKYPALTVIGRESSFRLRNTKLDSKQIGEKLGVANLLEGSVSREGNEVRVRAELVSTDNDRTLWSDEYDRPYKNLFDLEDDITKAAATALKAKILGNGHNGDTAQSDRPPSGSIKAYNFYLEGKFYSNQDNVSSFKKAISAYNKAIRLDPEYTAAYAGLSFTWTIYGGAIGTKEAYSKAKAAAHKALQLNSNSAAAHMAQSVLLMYTFNWNRARIEAKRSVALEPKNPDAKLHLAEASASLGQLNKAVHLTREAISTNPLFALSYLRFGSFLLGQYRFTQAITAYQQAISLAPTAISFHQALAIAEILHGDNQDALAAAESEPNPAWRASALALVYTAIGDTVLADRSLQTLIAKYANGSAYQIAEVYAYRRQPDQVFTWLDRAWRQHDAGITNLVFDPLLLRYKDDQRFTAFCKKVGLPPPDSTDAVSIPSNSEPQP